MTSWMPEGDAAVALWTAVGGGLTATLGGLITAGVIGLSKWLSHPAPFWTQKGNMRMRLSSEGSVPEQTRFTGTLTNSGTGSAYAIRLWLEDLLSNDKPIPLHMNSEALEFAFIQPLIRPGESISFNGGHGATGVDNSGRCVIVECVTRPDKRIFRGRKRQVVYLDDFFLQDDRGKRRLRLRRFFAWRRRRKNLARIRELRQQNEQP